jgi:NAD-dependent SIR2 family protein deacetylase
VAWQRFGDLSPNRAHLVLAALERTGKVSHVVTQNVDGLHQAAGSKLVTNLHGRIDQVKCLGCGELTRRLDLQARLETINAMWLSEFLTGSGGDLDKVHQATPDGDADLAPHTDYESFTIPACESCHGVLKPDVVFFGDSVPKETVEAVFTSVESADAILVVGSSLEVFSAYRFVNHATVKLQPPKPVAVLNLGRTRAERNGLPLVKIDLPCGEALWEVAAALNIVVHDS